MTTSRTRTRQRLSAATTALAALALTLALLVGLPWVLWQAAGVPWPDRVSSLSELAVRLTQPMSDPLLIELLALVGWVCWAAFACTVIREITWYATHVPQLVRDRGAHDLHLASTTLKGSLAALCIGTLIVALLALWRPQNAGAQPFAPIQESGSHPTVTAPFTPSPAGARLSTTPHPATAAGGVTRGSLPEYTVRDGDTLWDIARQHLGDGLKWPRIYALNKDRVQDDGTCLTDPELIRPGWRLAIPATHSTPTPSSPLHDHAHTQPAPETTPAPISTSPAQQAPTKDTRDGHPARTGPADPAPSRSGPHDMGATQRPAPATIGLGQAGLIGVTLAAGLLAARRYWHWHQRRLHDPETDTDIPALSPLVEKAAQAAHAATQHRTPPDPEDLVVRRTPPRPPLPVHTVSIGVRDNTEVPLDELATSNGCAWTGPGAEGAARALLVGILTAAERQRPGRPRVTAIVPEDLADALLPGLPPQFSALTQCADTTEAIQAAELHLLARARARHEHEHDAMNPSPGPNEQHPTRAADLGTLLLLTAPQSVHAGQLLALASRSDPDAVIVLTLKTALPGAERWHIAPDGATTRPARPAHPVTPLRLFHLTPDAGHEMTDVLLTAHGRRPHLRVLPIPSPAPSPTPRRPQSQPEPTPDDEAPDSSDPPLAPEPPAPARGKPVRLHIFGPITLYARGNPDPIGTQLRPEVHEFLALLAAHPAGLLASDIAEKLHLDPASDQNALKNLRRAVRRALRAATGITAQEFILRQGEFHKLHPDLVETDLAEFTAALNREFHPANATSHSNSLAAVQEALDHYRGPFAQGSDYLWADAVREHLAVKATDAALRLARAAERPDAASEHREAVLALLEHLGAVHPDHERLAQHTIRLCQAAGRHDAARHAYTRLERHLADLGLEPELPTKALIASRTAAPRTTSTR
ncbi:BTAD domain-containing putative transcriptional regulator [Actinacidiphila yeochonensis]|uniref:BTAD domain-containing putative transcriptional regulator n=1 Tax=Actinacidiphila yeochonensis TaxID=89050 RepID=UPI00055B16F6|nr:BTAD domain-containing putative transcriptional regulator [Actinacidiphila yeochonensis]